jgi:hypothetical protein
MIGQRIDPNIVGLHRLLDDARGPISSYGKHLLHFGESHDLLILNGISCFIDSSGFTCFPHVGGRANVVDYILANQDMLWYICQLSITWIATVDQALLSFFLYVDPSQPLPHPLFPLGPPCTAIFFNDGTRIPILLAFMISFPHYPVSNPSSQLPLSMAIFPRLFDVKIPVYFVQQLITGLIKFLGIKTS